MGDNSPNRCRRADEMRSERAAMEVEFNAAMQLLINQLHAHIAGGARGMDQLLQAVRLRDLASVQVLVPAHIDAAALNIPDNQTVRDRFPNVRTPIWYSGFSDYADLTVLQYAVLFTITSDSAMTCGSLSTSSSRVPILI